MTTLRKPFKNNPFGKEEQIETQIRGDAG